MDVDSLKEIDITKGNRYNYHFFLLIKCCTRYFAFSKDTISLALCFPLLDNRNAVGMTRKVRVNKIVLSRSLPYSYQFLMASTKLRLQRVLFKKKKKKLPRSIHT